jgi:hypothetical protein
MKSHRTDGVSLVFGLLFLSLAGWWWLSQVVHVAATITGWAAATALMILGIIGIVTAITGNRSRPEETSEESPDT